MRTVIEVTNDDIRKLIFNHLVSKLGDHAGLEPKDVVIEVRSKQNYKNHEWERGELRVRYEGEI